MDEFRKQPDSYTTLGVYRKAECIYDITYYFCHQFLNIKDRTFDQMVQGARSCKQNIVEGYSDAEGSTDSEHRLTVVAKGSLEELKEDYRDYLRNHGMEIWGPRHPKYLICREYFARHNDSAYYRREIKGRGAEEIANFALIVIHQELCILRGYIDKRDKEFKENGGIREQRAAIRRKHRGY